MLNWWAIHYDEKRFPNPEEFIPDRYFDKKLPAADYISHPDPYERDHFTYGAGRRSCPGVHLAEKSMVLSLRCGAYGIQFIIIARVLWGFDITWPLDKDGKPVEQDIMKMVYGFLSTPQEFKAKFTPRSPKHAQIFREEWEGTLHL